MTKSLYIVRHAKSSWDEPELADEERPLLEKGVQKTYKVIDYLNERQVTVDLILSSPAVRAYETARLIAQGIRYPVENISRIQDIYHLDTQQMLNKLTGLSDEIHSVMIVGHNPGVTQLASLLLGKQLDWLPTSAVVGIEFSTHQWQEIAGARRAVLFMIHPRMLT
ncbi:MAG: phosphohistidine phosphatase SixA [Bacteroidales bacterium]|nr:phosphohistidine phosphatase SixA [Lentimicrobiaceae bacterium]MDD5694801.1 phosphohistidine phosphatase SixA [Bacteroidales bacterium]